jgi:ESF2/ABP1 family protein
VERRGRQGQRRRGLPTDAPAHSLAQVAATLNGAPIGGKPRSAHRHDLWTLKYLPKFKWDDLTAEVAAQAAAREAVLATEAAAASRERDFYLGRVDAAKAGERAAKRRAAETEGGGEGDAAPPPAAKRHYGQRPAAPGPEERALGRDALAAIAGKG